MGEILLSHVLEHLGQLTSVYLNIIKELYRICANGAIIDIRVPHPRHDNFITDPTHVRPITREGLEMFNQALNRDWIERGWANTPLGVYMGVDFRIEHTHYILAEPYKLRFERGELTQKEIMELLRSHNNVVEEIHIKWRINKQ